ncbi:MAG: hypothetical protein LBU73_01440 [Helicobacteraceae bacterium]|jgi:hypothetical protein|nr:hypothetical protein [Helicobacteraceae bacterium]
MQTQTHTEGLADSETARLERGTPASFAAKSTDGKLGKFSKFSGDRAGLTPNFAKDAAFCDNKADGATCPLSFWQRAKARQKADVRQREIAEHSDNSAKRKTSRGKARNDSNGGRRARGSKTGFLAATILMALYIFAILPCEALAIGNISSKVRFSAWGYATDNYTIQTGNYLLPDTIKVAKGAIVPFRLDFTIGSGSALNFGCTRVTIRGTGTNNYKTFYNNINWTATGASNYISFTNNAVNSANVGGRMLLAPTNTGTYDLFVEYFQGDSSPSGDCAGTKINDQMLNAVLQVVDNHGSSNYSINVVPLRVAFGFSTGYTSFTNTDGTAYQGNSNVRYNPSAAVVPLKVSRGQKLSYRLDTLVSRTGTHTGTDGGDRDKVWNCMEADIVNINNTRVWHDAPNWYNNAHETTSTTQATSANGASDFRQITVPYAATAGGKYTVRFRFYDNRNGGASTVADNSTGVTGDRRCNGALFQTLEIPNAIEIINSAVEIRDIQTAYLKDDNPTFSLAVDPVLSPITYNGTYTEKFHTPQYTVGNQEPLIWARVWGYVRSTGISNSNANNWGCVQVKVLNASTKWDDEQVSTVYGTTLLTPGWGASNTLRGNYILQFYAPKEPGEYDVQYDFYHGYEITGSGASRRCRGNQIGSYIDYKAIKVNYVAEYSSSFKQVHREMLHGDIAAIGNSVMCVPSTQGDRYYNHSRNTGRWDKTGGSRGNNNIGVCADPQFMGYDDYNNWNLKYINFKPGQQATDPVEAHPSESRSGSTLDIPEDATITYARLYWIGRLASGNNAFTTYNSPAMGNCNSVFTNESNAANNLEQTKSVTLETPFGFTTALRADRTYINLFESNCNYSNSVDLTWLLKDKKANEVNGAYFVSGVKTRRNGGPYATHGSWTLVVSYKQSKTVYDQRGYAMEVPSAPPRIVTLYDIYEGTESNGHAIALDGFRTPRGGDVNSTLIVMGSNGESQSDDRLCINTHMPPAHHNQWPRNGRSNWKPGDATGGWRHCGSRDLLGNYIQHFYMYSIEAIQTSGAKGRYRHIFPYDYGHEAYRKMKNIDHANYATRDSNLDPADSQWYSGFAASSNFGITRRPAEYKNSISGYQPKLDYVDTSWGRIYQHWESFENGADNAFQSTVSVGPVGRGKFPKGQYPTFSAYGNKTYGTLKYPTAEPSVLMGSNYRNSRTPQGYPYIDRGDPEGRGGQDVPDVGEVIIGYDLHTYYLHNHLGNDQNETYVIIDGYNNWFQLAYFGFSTMIYAPEFGNSFRKEANVSYSPGSGTCGADGAPNLEDANVTYKISFNNSGKEPANSAIIFDDFEDNGIKEFFDMNSIRNVSIKRTRWAIRSGGAQNSVDPVVNCDMNATAVFCTITTVESGIDPVEQGMTSKPASVRQADWDSCFADRRDSNISGEFFGCGDAFEMEFTISVAKTITIVDDVDVLNEAKIRYYNASMGDLAIEESARSRVGFAGTICHSENCKYLKAQAAREGKAIKDGFFLVDPDNTRPNGIEPIEVYCENMSGKYDPKDPSTFPVDYLPLPFQSDYSNFRFVTMQGKQYYRPAQKVAIPMLPLAELDRTDSKFARSFRVDLNGKFISYASGGTPIAGFSNLNLQGTSFYIDRDKSSFSPSCGGKTPFTQAVRSGVILGMNDQIMKINPNGDSYQQSCQPTMLVLTQLSDYRYEYDGNEGVRGNKIEVDCESDCKASKGADPTGGKIGNASGNAQRYSFESCKQLNESPKNKGKLQSGHYYVSPLEKNSKRLTDLEKRTIEQRPFVAYCDTTTVLDDETGGMMTMFVALDANETFNVSDLLPREQDSCSQLGLAFFVPVTQPIFEDVRKQLLKRKSSGSDGRAGWRDYLGTYNDMRGIFFPGKKYFVEDIGNNAFWPYGPLGIYSVKFEKDGKIITVENPVPGQGAPGGATLLGKEDCRYGGGTYDSACDVPMYSADYNEKSTSMGAARRPRFVPGWTLGDRGFQSIFEKLGIKENQYDRRYEGKPDEWGDVVTWWWISDYSCGRSHIKSGKIRPKKVFWMGNKDLDNISYGGKKLRDLPRDFFIANTYYPDTYNYPPQGPMAQAGLADNSPSRLPFRTNPMPQTEPNGNYRPGDWLDYVADEDGNIFHCDDSMRYPLNDLPALNSPLVDEAGYSYVHYTCLSKDSYTAMNFGKATEIKGIGAWDGNENTHARANADRADVNNVRLFTKEIGEPAIIRVGGIDTNQKFSAMMCSRIVEEVQDKSGNILSYNPISDWNASFSYEDALVNVRADGAEGADFGQVVLFPQRAVRHARIETRYVLAEVAGVDMATNNDAASRLTAFASGENGGYKCTGNTDEDFETPDKWSKFTDNDTLSELSLDNFAVKPRYFELAHIKNGAVANADTGSYVIAEVDYINDPSVLVSGIEGMTKGGFVLGAPIPTSANGKFRAFGYNQSSANRAIVISPAWNEDLGQPNREIIQGVPGANFVDGLSDLNITFADVGVFSLIVEDNSWTATDQLFNDCLVAGDPNMPDTVKTGNAHYINIADRPTGGREGSSDNEADYKIGCSIGGKGVKRGDKFIAGATEQLLRSGLSHFAVTGLTFDSPLQFSSGSDKNMWAYYSGDTNESFIRVTGEVVARGAKGKTMRNYTEGNYSLPTLKRTDSYPGLYFVLSGNDTCANRKDLFCDLIYPNTNEWYFSQQNIESKDWGLQPELASASYSNLEFQGKAQLNTMWNFTRRTTPMLPTHLKSANQDFNITIVEDTTDLNVDRQINENPVTGGVIWSDKANVNDENRTTANASQITFVYGRANVHDVVSYTEEAYLTYSIDYYNPSSSNTEVNNAANAGFNHPLPSTASTSVGSAGWARILASSGAPNQAFDGTSEANFSVKVESQKAKINDTWYSPYYGGLFVETNIKLHEQKGVAAGGSKDFRVEYKDGMQDRKRDFISHLSVPTYLWYKQGMKPYLDIRHNIGDIDSSLRAYEHPTGKVTFLKPEGDKWIGTGETKGRHFEDDANESKAPQRIWW